MIECPGCHRELSDRAVACNSCGYEFPKRVDGSRGRDPLHWICAHIDRGQRCAKLGGMSPNTRGDGPYYCWDHAPGFGGRSPAAGPTPAYLAAKRALFKPLDAEAELERAAIQTEETL